MLLPIYSVSDKERIVRNGGQIVETYSKGWLAEVDATPVGDVSYRLVDGTILRGRPVHEPPGGPEVRPKPLVPTPPVAPPEVPAPERAPEPPELPSWEPLEPPERRPVKAG